MPIPKYHVGNGLLDIYAGTQDSDGNWVHFSKVTADARRATMKWKKDMMLEHNQVQSRERYVFRDGTRLTVEYHLEQAQM